MRQASFWGLLLWLCLGPGSAAEAARPYRGGAVATAHAEASGAAKQMLDRGGTAVDAAVAAAFVLGVVGPYHSGIGGGGFALVFDQKTGQSRVLDFREVAPKAATRDMFVREGEVVPGLSIDGALSVAVPGAAKGYLELHAAGGKLPLKVVMAPAIRAAQEGFAVTPRYRAIAEARKECLEAHPEAARLFLTKGKDGGYQVPEVGAIIRQRDLGRTLTRLSREGARAFYAGPVARALVESVRAKGGILALEDLAGYRTRWREPLVGGYRGHRIVTMPPPSAGGLAVVQVLAGLERLEPSPAALGDPEHLHRLAELVRRAYVDRARYLGDPAFAEVPIDKLTSPEHLAAMAAGVDPAKATPSRSLLDAGPASEGGTLRKRRKDSVPHPEASPGGRNTTHLSVVDRHGNAVALTTTLNYGFGSCLVAKGTGVLLNDEMDDFAAQPMVPNAYGLVTGEANAVAPGKIPLSSMSPTIVFQRDDPKRVMLVVGSPGGSTIPTTVIQVIRNVVDLGMDVQRAVGHGRIHHQYLPDRLMVDRYGLELLTRRALEAKGHALQDADAWGDAEAVHVDGQTGLRTSASDPRGEGAAVGQD
jgi:gamma-glutamyltranspeptidase/glutathione hydrolase